MSIKQELLEILCCPLTKVPVKILEKEKLQKLNEKIAQKTVKYSDGSLVVEPLSEGLITEDGKTIYRVDQDIPIMLIDKGISVEQTGSL